MQDKTVNTPLNDNPPDYIQRFHFHELALRGAIVKLTNSYIEALNNSCYHQAVNCMLGECLAASVLMSANFKKTARLSLQARGSGPVKLLMAETHMQRRDTPFPADAGAIKQSIRAVAKMRDSADGSLADAGLTSLLGNAQLAITIEPEGQERYQGIVGLEADSLDACLQNYFLRSEQLPTFIKLHASEQQAAGLLLQQIPERNSHFDREAQICWEEIAVLASSIRRKELLELPAEQTLHRLFHQHPYTCSAAQPVEFACSCSAQRTGAALLQIDPREIEAILDEEGEIIMDCDFCSTRYRFNKASIEQLAAHHQATRH